ncbi:MBL fold metallo-hydrolase [Euzebya tangerina]|uniref:MBL fold metallo-hydrolase n=1 Tax=Euzebya tangerina TaxID=591198 RepID=UPI000E314DAF|nr:MBL fold metallo-hydrolase [Euzebya tangerina]
MSSPIDIAPDVLGIPIVPGHGINAYLIGDVLIDAGTRFSRTGLLKALRGRPLRGHALTHAHPDHQGSSAAICTELDVPLWVGTGDADAAESGDLSETFPRPSHPVAWFQRRFLAGPGHPVGRRLQEGDRIGEFRVLDLPGHTRGHIGFYRDEDRVLIAGDLISHKDMGTFRTKLVEHPDLFTVDRAASRRSAQRLIELEPETVCLGHGPPVRDPRALQAFLRRIVDAPAAA